MRSALQIFLVVSLFVALQGFTNVIRKVNAKNAMFHPRMSRAPSGSKALLSHSTSALYCEQARGGGVDSTEQWRSVLSLNQDLDEAVCEVLDSLLGDKEESSAYRGFNVGIFYSSSVYEASAFKYDSIFSQLKERLPNLEIVVGCTTGAVVGSTIPGEEPQETEGRASFSLLLGNVSPAPHTQTEEDSSSSSASGAGSFFLSQEQIRAYNKDPTARIFDFKNVDSSDTNLSNNSDSDSTNNSNNGKKTKAALVFTTEGMRPQLSSFLQALKHREGLDAFGATASSVTSLHTPKVFLADYRKGKYKFEGYV